MSYIMSHPGAAAAPPGSRDLIAMGKISSGRRFLAPEALSFTGFAVYSGHTSFDGTGFSSDNNLRVTGVGPSGFGYRTSGTDTSTFLWSVT